MNIVVITPSDDLGWEWFGSKFEGHDWTFVNLNLFRRGALYWFWRAGIAVSRLKKGQVVASHYALLSLCVAFWIFILGKNNKHLAFSFNHGDGRFFRGILWRVALLVLRKVDAFFVYSNKEREIYSAYYHLPLNKFYFSHWAVQKNTMLDMPPPYIQASTPYICAMGRNNRDFAGLVEAVRGLSVNVILVCSPGAMDGISIPANVLVKSNLSLKECTNILAGSLFNVVPLKDASAGAGHMTIVSAMHYGIPSVITKVSTVSDYFFDGVHGLFFEPGSVEDLRSKLEYLLKHPETCHAMAQSCKDFASRWLYDDAAKRYLAAVLDAVSNEKEIPRVPLGWVEYVAAHQG